MTTHAAILADVNTVFEKVFEKPGLVVTDATAAKDIPEWDSLIHTTLIAAVEQHFKIKFTLREVLRFQNVGDMIAVILKKLSA
ncbi:MAG: acyl carrier protein [Polyangiaceae bacterium]